jgi:two-component system chemotaxis sensor kinase CheA
VKIPLTLAIIPGLIVVAENERFVIPQVNLHELIQLTGDAMRTGIEYIHSARVLRRRNALVPLADLCEVLGLGSRRSSEEVSIAIVEADGQRFGLIVDEISDSQEIVVKPLGQQLKGLNCYAGATIMGDGGIALILDIMGLGLRSGVVQPSGRQGRSSGRTDESAAIEDCLPLLLVRAGGLERLAIPLSRVARLERIPIERLERAAGRSVVQYRGRILPLIMPAEMPGGGLPPDAEQLQVVVCRNGEADFGLVVDEIVDIVRETVAHPGGTDRPGLLGSAVVGGKVTDFLDLDALSQGIFAGSSKSLDRLDAVLSGGTSELPGDQQWR